MIKYFFRVTRCIILGFSIICASVSGQIPVIVEAESGKLGEYFSTQTDGEVAYITTSSNYTGQDGPGDSSRVATYNVVFEESGLYNLFVRVRVGAGSFDDDSFFYGVGFGEKDANVGADWHLVNGLGIAGFSDPDYFVDEPGPAGTEIWKWVNITKNGYQSSSGVPFSVNEDNLSRTFQIGSREDGFDVDKIAFGKSDLYYTVNDLDNELPGSTTLDDSSYVYPGPPLAEGHTKFLGCSFSSNTDYNIANYWNQITPGNMGKWESVGTSTDTAHWNWSSLDFAYNYAKENNLLFKDHTLIWGEQQPDWINDFNSADQLTYIETWIRMVGQRYPDMDMIDVVNEPLPNHNPPDGIVGSANYKEALGGDGDTGWDWVIKSFELARKYMPNTELILNDYGIINSNSNTTVFLQIINLLKDRGLIDGIGVQGHRFEFENTNTTTLKYNLDRLYATGLPIYISEMDLGNISDSGDPDDAKQLELYQKIFPVLWEHPGVKGITLWGYVEGSMWQRTCFLVRYDGTWRPAMEWLAQYLMGETGVIESGNSVPSHYALEQNYPNPFNPTTNISFTMRSNEHVNLTVYDVTGKGVETLINGKMNQGTHQVTWYAENYASGVYFLRLTCGDITNVRKMIIQK